MEKTKCISPDMEPFLNDVAMLFTEASNKGTTRRDNFKAMSIPISNYLLDCSKMTVSKAKAATNLKLPNGEAPNTVLPRPPAWLKISSKEHAQLQRASKAEKFMKKLRSLVEKQSALPDGSKRAASHAYQPPAKKARKGATKKPKEEPLVKTEPISAEAAALPCAGIPAFKGCTTNIEQTYGQPTCAHHQTSTEQTYAAAREGVKAVHLWNPPTATETGAEDGDSHRATTRDAVFDVITAHHIGQVFGSSAAYDKDSDTHSEGESHVSISMSENKPSDYDEHSVEPDAISEEEPAPQTEDILNKALEAIKTIQSVGAEDWDAYRPEFVHKLCTLRLIRADPGAEHDTQLLDALSRFSKALEFVKEQATQVPPKAWMKYQRKLAGFCSQPETEEMHLTKRLAKFGSWVYLSEETAITSGDWARVENAVHLSAKLAEITGKDGEGLHQDKTKDWCSGKLKTLESLKGILVSDVQVQET